MKILLTIAGACLVVAACSGPDLAITPDPAPVATVTHVESYVGLNATRAALRDVERELGNPVALAAAARSSGQSVSDRRTFLEALVHDLTEELNQYDQDSSLAGSCVVHDDAEYRQRFSTVEIYHGTANASGYTSATKTTAVTTSVFGQVWRGVNSVDYALGQTDVSSMSCGLSAYTSLRMTYSISDRWDRGQTFTVYGETAHIIPGNMTWTSMTDRYTFPPDGAFGAPPGR